MEKKKSCFVSGKLWKKQTLTRRNVSWKSPLGSASEWVCRARIIGVYFSDVVLCCWLSPVDTDTGSSWSASGAHTEWITSLLGDGNSHICQNCSPCLVFMSQQFSRVTHVLHRHIQPSCVLILTLQVKKCVKACASRQMDVSVSPCHLPLHLCTVIIGQVNDTTQQVDVEKW